MKIMPTKLTDEMLKAACAVKGMSLTTYRAWWEEHYQALYDAAPQEQQELQDKVERLEAELADLKPKEVIPECCVCGTKEGLRKDGWYGYRCGSNDCVCF